MFGFIALLHLIGWITLVVFVAPEHYSVGDKALGIGVGLTAYTLGLRHAFDADHIAAIDNTTRKLMGDGQRPLGVGFFFSLGHSTVVFGLAVLLSVGVKAIVGPVEDDSSALHHYTGLIGTSVSGLFLYLIAAINLVILVGILRVFPRMRRRRPTTRRRWKHQLNNRGLLNGSSAASPSRSPSPGTCIPSACCSGSASTPPPRSHCWCWPAPARSPALPWYAILCLPMLFAAGMSLLDTIDGSFMNFAYGWAFSNPLRKVYYNLTITGLSVAVALLIGSVELLGLLAEQLGLSGGVLGLGRGRRPQRRRLRRSSACSW